MDWQTLVIEATRPARLVRGALWVAFWGVLMWAAAGCASAAPLVIPADVHVIETTPTVVAELCAAADRDQHHAGVTARACHVTLIGQPHIIMIRGDRAALAHELRHVAGWSHVGECTISGPCRWYQAKP